MTIKISQLGNLTAVSGNVQIPVVSNITGTFTTVKSNIDQIGQYITSGAYTYGNLIPSANVTYSLGSLTNQWKDLYLSGSTIYLGNTTIKAGSGSITCAPAPVILWDTLITTNNVVPANVQVTGGQANGSGILSATLTYRIGDGSYNIYNMTYGTDYVINPWVDNLGNLQILLTSTYLYGTLGWIGFGNVYITETSPTSATLSNVGLTTGNISTPTGNLAITGNVSTTGNITGPTISALYANIISSNTGLRGYVDQANTIQSAQISAANIGIIGYIDRGNTIQSAQVGAANLAITASNVGMKGYVDQANTIQSGQIGAANLAITAANVGMKGYVDNQTYSNVKVAQYLPTYSGNVGSLLNLGDFTVFGGNITAGFALPNTTYANVIFNGVGRANGYSQLNIQNVDSVGTQTSADFIATAPNGTDSTNFIDMGINGNNYSSGSWTVSGANDGYLYVNSGNLTLGTDTANKSVSIHVGGTLAANVIATFNSSNVTIGGNLIVSNVYVPTANNSIGTRGQISYDSSYVYVCIAANTWRRANLAIW
jgi:hypothetical protein